MKKRQIQILVVFGLAVLTLGGAWLNQEFAHESAAGGKAQTESTKAAQGKTASTTKKEQQKKKEQSQSAKEATSQKAEKGGTTVQSEVKDKDGNLVTAAEKAQTDASETNSQSQPASNGQGIASADNNGSSGGSSENNSSAPATPNQPATNSEPEPSQSAPAPEPEVKAEVTMSIRGTVANSAAFLVAPQKVRYTEGQTAMEVLAEFCRQNGIQADIRGGAYVAGINNLYEFDKGASSGWLYRVNGQFPSYGAAQYTLTSGAVLEWLYTEDMGKDIGAPQG